MSTFTMAIAMNPNINSEQFAELCEKDAQMVERLTNCFSDCLARLETEEQKHAYYNACFPVLMMFL